ncbi:MAG: hypothetical protein ABEI53_01110 [Candidatus Magasanikbacteria bacterium]
MPKNLENSFKKESMNNLDEEDITLVREEFEFEVKEDNKSLFFEWKDAKGDINETHISKAVQDPEKVKSLIEDKIEKIKDKNEGKGRGQILN